MIFTHRTEYRIALAVLFTLAVTAASAHTGEGIDSGFESGFWHPILGWDHVVAMVAVGLWGAFLGSPAIWILPVVFPLVMALGGALGVIGVPLPMVETGIALSGVVLGLLIALAARAPLWVAALIVGIFAIFHGHAHGTELPESFQRLRLCGRLRRRHRPVAPCRHRVRPADRLEDRHHCGSRRWRRYRAGGRCLSARRCLSRALLFGA